MADAALERVLIARAAVGRADHPSQPTYSVLSAYSQHSELALPT
jgi:hypothetical protein